ncbi:MAG: FAD-dependent oxidoreductase [Rhizobiaceae bacterium]
MSGPVQREPEVIWNQTPGCDVNVDVLVIGAGACGCCAALSANELGADALIVERDASPAGNTSLSGGQIPGALTQLQKEAEIADSAELLADDLIAKARGQSDTPLARHIAAQSASTIDWLNGTIGVPLSPVDQFRYPGHSAFHMHATPAMDGSELLAALLEAVSRANIDLLTSARATTLYADSDCRVTAVGIERPDGKIEIVGCKALVLACNGFGGNRQMLREFIPHMADAHYHGHAGNQGEAMRWGAQLGCRIADAGSYQGHGAVITPQMIHLGWAAITEGGFQVNSDGKRFSHENEGYSEQAAKVLAQPGQIAWTIFDGRCHQVALLVHSHRDAEAVGAIRTATTVAEMAGEIGCPADELVRTVDVVEQMANGEASDPFGRDFSGHPSLVAPYRFAKVTGALFHTQGGLEVDIDGRVLLLDGRPSPNLFAGGGAARGLSGPSDWGYLSGSGLLTATNLGRLAGSAAARLAGYQ